MKSSGNWNSDWFGEDYLKVYPHRDEAEARTQVLSAMHMLNLSGDEEILDLGCGNGRHALELSRAGHRVTGADLSFPLLGIAQTNSRKTFGQARFVRADMRRLPFVNAFDAVVSFFTTFGYFETTGENLKTLLSIRQALKAGGRFLQDYLNKRQVLDNLVPRDTRRENGFEIIQERRYDSAGERIEKKITLRDAGGERQYFESVRLYTPEEMESLLQQAGLRLDRTYGDFDGRPFDKNSPRLILVGHKEDV